MTTKVLKSKPNAIKNWRYSNGSYEFDGGEIHDRIRSDIYKMSVSYTGQIVLTKKEIKTEHLIIDPNDSNLKYCLEDIEGFWASKEKYKMFNLTYKRGFFLHGK